MLCEVRLKKEDALAAAVHATRGVMDLADQDGLDMSRSCGFKVVSEFRGFDEALTAKYRQKLRGKRSLVLCKVETKSRLRSNYSYYRILIVEDVQLIVNRTQ